ncbi:alpha/beta fold hydrolase [Candidatus Roizmanbacteria bacterium]|nr:alpha/beta fold hydrolase [Candidatus Roizmanbacteria bacterium]
MFKKLFKLTLIFLIFLTYLCFAKSIFAFEFVKSTNNPLPVSYINNYTSQLQANIFKEGNIYKGIFVINRPPENYYSLGYFESVNGIDWQMKKEILNTGTELSSPRILKIQTGYVLFLTRYDNNNIYRIYSSSCDFNFNCSSSFVPVITPDTNNNSENNGVFAGNPFTQNSRTYLFFGAWGGDGFKIKLAYSDDLITWQRCPNAFLYGGDGPFPYQENSDLYLFFHSSDNSGIKLAKTALPLNCNAVFVDQGYLLIKDKSYDQRHLIFPSILNDDGGLKLFYSGLGSDRRWRLNLACTGQTCLQDKIPIVIIPGLMASWNREAIIHNVEKPQFEWKLNPIVNEYKGMINTLKNLGYEENKNLFVFAYDWRKPVLSIVDDLNNFLNQLAITKFQLVGHSLGGLVGRIYSQKYSNPNIDKLITVGSPHHGASQSYKIVEAGEIDRFNDYLWLAVKMVATLNRNSLETDKQTLARLFPIMKDLFPVYNFLKKDGNEINIADMKIKNELLPYYNTNLNNGTLTTLVGEKGSTTKGFNVASQTFLDKLLDNYPDGSPQSPFFDIGDYTVLSSSATLGTPVIFSLDHNELIYKKEAIKKILDLLNIQYSDTQIIEGKRTVIDTSLIFLIKSPARMEVVYNGQTYLEQDGMIFIENASGGDYQLKVKGLENGAYTVIVGQIGKEKDLWNEIKGEITGNPPASQTDNYNIKFDSNFPKPINNSLSLLNEIIFDLNNFNSYNIAAVGYMRNDLKQAKKYLGNNDSKKLRSVLLLAHSRLMIISNKINDENGKSIASSVFEKLENLFISSLQDYSLDQKTINATITQFTGYQKLINEQSSRLLNLQNKGKDISKQLSLIKDVNTKLLNVSGYLNSQKYSNSEILLKTVGYLMNEIKK